MAERKIISTPSLFEVDETFDDPRFMKVRINMMTTGINRNASSFSLDVIKEAKETFKNIPVLANVIETEDEEGNITLDYGSHDMHIEDDKFNVGEERIIYDERVVGLVPESNNFEIIKNDETGEHNVYCDALLLRDYGNYVCDILKSRNGETDVSMEIICDDLSYSEKDNVIVVGKMVACAVTLLGANITPAMPGAHAEMFALKNDDRVEQLAKIMQELKESLDNYMAIKAEKSQRKEENNQMNHFEELLQKYGKTVEEITFSYEGLSDEELDAAFAEAFEKTPTNENTVPQSENVEFSVTYKGETKCFAKSLNDQIREISELVNATYGNEDNAWYDCEVFDDRTVLFHDWWNNKHFKQKYGNKEGNLVLKGERTEVFVRYLTEDELSALDDLKSNFEIKEKECNEAKETVAKYEAEPQKMELLQSEAYKQVAETAEFSELMKKEAHFDLSIEDVRAKADEILLNAAKAGKVEFAKVEPKQEETVGSKPLMPFSNPKKRYIGLDLN